MILVCVIISGLLLSIEGTRTYAGNKQARDYKAARSLSDENKSNEPGGNTFLKFS